MLHPGASCPNIILPSPQRTASGSFLGVSKGGQQLAARQGHQPTPAPTELGTPAGHFSRWTQAPQVRDETKAPSLAVGSPTEAQVNGPVGTQSAGS